MAEEREIMPFGIKSRDEYSNYLLDLQKVLSYPCGKNVILKIIGSCGIFDATDNFSNQMQAFKEGTRNVGLQLLHGVMDIDNGKMFADMLSQYWQQVHSRRN